MTQQVVLAFGGGAIWIRKPFEALAARVPVWAATPKDPLSWLRERHAVEAGRRPPGAGIAPLSILMPFAWASWMAPVSQRTLWRRALALSRIDERDVKAVFVTTPHYWPMVRAMGERVPIYYYAADSYRDYPGWNAGAMAAAEGDIVRAARRSFFVSDALMHRAIAEYGVPTDRVAVSMNATGEEFLAKDSRSADYERVAGYLAGLPRPVVVVVGATSQRLDFPLLARCADSPHVGSLVFVGPHVGEGMTEEQMVRFAALKGHSKVRFVGPRPHRELPLWNALTDVALIPYRRSQLNHFCSPMRLFDHLASGRPVVATNSCQQVEAFSHLVRVARTDEEVVEHLAADAGAGDGTAAREAIRSCHLWSHRGAALDAAISCAR